MRFLVVVFFLFVTVYATDNNATQVTQEDTNSTQDEINKIIVVEDKSGLSDNEVRKKAQEYDTQEKKDA